MIFTLLDILWDKGNREKCQKHGVSIEEIETLLRQPEVWIAPDIRHSEREARYLAVGKVPKGRYLFVIFTLRGDLLRPISARYMHRKEIKRYEEEIADDQNR